jgi:hypothetical protein
MPSAWCVTPACQQQIDRVESVVDARETGAADESLGRIENGI